MRKLFLVLTVFAILLTCAAPAIAADHVQVYYAGPRGAVRQALDLARYFETVADPAQADVFILNGSIPNPKTLRRASAKAPGWC